MVAESYKECLAELARTAIAAKERAYCPYSAFRVGAALLTSTGEIITGCNVENASYPVGTCAERCALATAVAAGHRNFTLLVVSTDVNTSKPASPCGMCRQFIREFCSPEMPVVLMGRQEWEGIGGKVEGDLGEVKHVVRTVEELLPDSFGPEDLPRHK